MNVIEEKIRELRDEGFCILRGHYRRSTIEACRRGFWPTLSAHLDAHAREPNRGPSRHFVTMPFTRPCFDPAFFFDEQVLKIVRTSMDDRVVADQWGCDVPLRGSVQQAPHVDYRRPLFGEAPDLPLPPYMLVVGFGLVPITRENGPIEIAGGTHRMAAEAALAAVQRGEIPLEPVLLDPGDVLIRHPWAVHRGTPNTTETPRPLVTIRYVRRWYADDSREVTVVPGDVWQSLTAEQRSLMRFPVSDDGGSVR